MNLTDLIFEKKDFLHKDDCEAWIDWFWLNQQYHDKGDSGNEEKHKKAIQVDPIVGGDFWCQIAIETDRAINAMYEWGAKDKLLWRAPLVSYDHAMRCYKKQDGWFKDHIDLSPTDPLLLSRVYAMVIYLDDVEEGGETEFSFLDYKVKPEQGKLLMFPCNQLYPYKENKPMSGPKHVVTAFFCSDLPAPHYVNAQHPNQQHKNLYAKHMGIK